MDKLTILICDDNLSVHESLSAYLTAANMRVISLYDGSSLLKTLTKEHVDLLILDIMLPGRSGTELCQNIRESGNDIPIIMLSAKGEEDDRVSGLFIGADDYVTKPFSPREIVMRIMTILKRTKPQITTTLLQAYNLTLYTDSYKVLIGEAPLELTPKEFSVLHCLVTANGNVLTREHILNEVWGYDYYGDTRAVNTIVKRLRSKLNAGGASCTIRSIYGVGYRLEAV